MLYGYQIEKEPETVGQCVEIHRVFGLVAEALDKNLFRNAKVLTDINNEIYELRKKAGEIK